MHCPAILSRLFRFALIITAIFSISCTELYAASALEIDAKANAALQQFYLEVPAAKELAEKSVATLVFPEIIKLGLLLGGEYGEGVLRTGQQSAGYYSIFSGSFGLQAGVQAKRFVLLFMTQEALDRFRASRGWKAGVEGSLAIMALGTGGAIDTTSAQPPVIGFVFGQEGLMGNLTLEGGKISPIVR